MRVEQLMVRDVKFCRIDDDLNTAAGIMWDNDCGCVPVVDESHKVVGMITDRDICMATYTQGLPPRMIKVSSAMARKVFSVGPEDDLTLAYKLLKEHQIHRLPVTDPDGKLVGILSFNDLAREAGREGEGAVKREVASADIADILAAICRPRYETRVAMAA